MIRLSVVDAFAQRLCPLSCGCLRNTPWSQLNITAESYFIDLEQEQLKIPMRLEGHARTGAALSGEYLDQRDRAARDRRFVTQARKFMSSSEAAFAKGNP